MTILTDFEAEHREIENAVSMFLALLAEASPPDTHRLMSARWRLTFLISRHVSVEDTHLYPIIAADMRAEAAGIIDRFSGQIGIFRQKFRDWQVRWSSERLAGDWEGFRRDSFVLFDDLNERIREEEMLLFPLIEEAERKLAAKA